MQDRDLEHPIITQIERDGEPIHSHEPQKICSRCDYPIEPGKHYGECNGKILCVECIDDELKELTAQEKFDKLGYNVEYNG